MLGQHRTNAGAGKLAAIADRHRRRGDDGAEHARARAAPGNRVGHGWSSGPELVGLSVSCEIAPVQAIREKGIMSDTRAAILRWTAEDRDKLVGFLAALVRLPSPNPPGDTRAAAAFLHDELV